MAEEKHVTFKAPVNIAVVKYWGKRDETLNLPLNGSISVTLGLSELCAKTTVAASKKFITDRFWLNGREEDISKNPRMLKCLKEVRRTANKRKLNEDKIDPANLKVHICSENNFPTAAGLASSAAGYACLVSALSKLYGVKGDTSYIARQGSGSACRSMFGGFVKWNEGENESGMDSVSVQIAPKDHWPELRVLILVVNDQKKATSSSIGMQRSATTSELLKLRAANIVPRRMMEMEEAILSKDFPRFAELTMKESNQLHAVCLDTFPPITYLNSTSHRIIELISTLNELSTAPKAGYTFDAGPNAFIFTTEENVAEVISLFTTYFGPEDTGNSFIRGIPLKIEDSKIAKEATKQELEKRGFLVTKGELKYIIHTKCGCGPEELYGDDSLLNQYGQPRG